MRILALLVLVTTAIPALGAPPTEAEPSRPLLREGSYLTAVAGRIRRDPEGGWWVLMPESSEIGPLVLLPNRRLEEMAHIADAAGDRDAVFEVTGRVTVYRGRNYLLVTHAPTVSAYDEPETAAPAPEGDEAAEPDSVEAIMREVATAVGPLRRRSAAPDLPAPVGAEGETILWRRGTLRRSDDGAWLFVFDADAEGLADPPVVVLPSLVLEHMQQHIARAGHRAPILLSGERHEFGGRSYVLASVYRVPR